MSSTPDSTNRLADLWERIPSDSSDLQNAARHSAELGRRVSGATLTAAQRSLEQSAILVQDGLVTMRAVAHANKDASDRRTALKGLAADSLAIALRHARGFASIAHALRGDMMDILRDTAAPPSAKGVARADTRRTS